MANTLPQAPSASDLARSTPASRDRTIDFLRIASLGVVVLGHWLMAAVTFHDGRFGATNVLQKAPALALLTWVLQVMPVFFFVGGYANAVTIDSYRRRGLGAADFVAGRAARLMRPVVVLLAVWVPFAVVAATAGASTRDLGRMTRLVCQPLWFLAVYLFVVAAAPAMLALHRRYGARVPVALALGAVAVDLLRFAGGVPFVAWSNLAFVWLFAQQLGFHDADHALERLPRRVVARVAVLAFAVLGALVAFGPYPASMVGLPGDRFSNMAPPTLCLLVVTVAQVALVTLARPALARFLRRERVWTAVVAGNGVIMTVFLWHLTALLLAVVVAFPLGFPQPAAATTWWWTTRPLWIAVLLVPLALLVRAFGRWERPRPAATGEPAAAAAVFAGAALLVSGLGALAATNFGRVTALDGPASVPACIAYLGLGTALTRVTRVTRPAPRRSAAGT